MKWNEGEVLVNLRGRTADWEGRLSYKSPKQSGTFHLQNHFKERYLKLYGNLLLLQKMDREEHTNLFLLENYTVQEEDRDIFLFSVIFQVLDGSAEKHQFVAVNLRSMNQWMEALTSASYEKKRTELILLQIKLRSRTGTDPLLGTSMEHNPVYSLATADVLHVTPKEKKRRCNHAVVRASAVSNNNHRGPGLDSGSNFTSHLGIQIWEDSMTGRSSVPCEQCGLTGGDSGGGGRQTKSSFKSHVKPDSAAETGNLIQF